MLPFMFGLFWPFLDQMAERRKKEERKKKEEPTFHS